MNSYRLGVRIKLGLIVAAILIALGSLLYTNRLVDKLKDREAKSIQLYASAIEHISTSAPKMVNPHHQEFDEMTRYLTDLRRSQGASGQGNEGVPDIASSARWRSALNWSKRMPPADPGFVFDIVADNAAGVPAVITDTNATRIWAHNIEGLEYQGGPVDTTTVIELASQYANTFEPIPIYVDRADGSVETRLVNYGESGLVKELRLFPYIQLLFVGLFILVGYLGFSYVRKNEQSNLWVGMAKEAAHQLGTPISSMMGWVALLKEDASTERVDLLDELDEDIVRLQRVASRFSKIGSRPNLTETNVSEVLLGVTDYIRTRIPSLGGSVSLNLSTQPDIKAPLNAELFEWVVENLLKNALDAIEKEPGEISVVASESDSDVTIRITDNGKGIDKRQRKNVFRPGYSTKKRGWGLGLSLAKRIVEDYHGGSLSLVNSRVDHGATFQIVLKKTDLAG